jgi:hypothetical protein
MISAYKYDNFPVKKIVVDKTSIFMKKIFLILAAALSVSFAACSDKNDGNDKTYGTGEMDPDATVTAPDEPDSSPATIMSDTSSRNSAPGTAPGSDNPRKNDIGGQKHPMDTANGGVKK